MDRKPSRRKAERQRLARAELWMQLAMSAERWKNELTVPGRSAPFEDWPEDDALKRLCRVYDLTPGDLARVAEGIAEQLEARALRNGYDEASL